MLNLQLRLYFVDCFFFFFFFFFIFSFSHFSIFFFFFNVKHGRTPLYVAAFKGYKQIVQILLEKGKPIVDLANKVLFCLIVFFFFFFVFFHFLIFLFFFFLNQKNGMTPLYVAAAQGHDQIVELLLEKGKPNVDLANKVLFCLIISFSVFFFSLSLIFLIFFECKERNNSSFYCCSKWA